MSDPRIDLRTKERPDNVDIETKSRHQRGEAFKEPKNDATDDILAPLPCVSRNEIEPLTVPKVLEYFKLASNPEVTISVPPIRPKGGEVYLFIPESSDTTSKILAILANSIS